MAVPTLARISQDRGPTTGGDIVRLAGTNLGPELAVWFGGAEAKVLRVASLGATTFADVRTPPHVPAIVDVVAWNVDAEGLPLPEERATLAQAYRYLRSPLTSEAELTRLVRTVIQTLKRDVLENTSITVSVDYQDPVDDDNATITVSRFPSLVLSGPTLRENRFYRSSENREEIVAGDLGPEVVKRRPPFTADLSFTITGASSSTVELLNLMNAVGAFIARNRWIEMARDPSDPTQKKVRWELDPEGDFRTRLGASDGVRVFTAGIIVRGFDIEGGTPVALVSRVREAEIETESFVVEAAG